MLRSLVGVLALLLVVAPIRAADAADAGRVADGATPEADVRARAGSGPLPVGCAPNEVADLVVRFLDAVSRGDLAGIAAFCPEEPGPGAAADPGFQWYSVTDASAHFVAYDPADLPAHFAARAARHERFRLVEIEVASGWHGGVDVAFDLVREAEDFPRREVGGKGAIACERQEIIVWSLGDAEVFVDDEPPAGGARRATGGPVELRSGGVTAWSTV